jgi:hypothetical protein
MTGRSTGRLWCAFAVHENGPRDQLHAAVLDPPDSGKVHRLKWVDSDLLGCAAHPRRIAFATSIN